MRTTFHQLGGLRKKRHGIAMQLLECVVVSEHLSCLSRRKMNCMYNLASACKRVVTDLEHSGRGVHMNHLL